MSRTEPTALPSDNDLVIGEGVVLDVAATSFATRLLSALIDYVLLGIIGFLVLLGLGGLIGYLDLAAAGAIFTAFIVAIFVGVPTAVETLSRGRSLGKLILGLRVVRDDGGPIRVRQASIRALVGVLELWMTWGAVAIICSLANSRGKRVGDLLAGTYVVRERGYRPAPVYLMMPPPLAGWAAGADIGRLPDDLAMAIRQFLTRTQLVPSARAELGSRLADQTLTYVAPVPPPGTHPEAFLTAVLVERRDRELARLQREQQAAAARERVLHRLPHGAR